MTDTVHTKSRFISNTELIFALGIQWLIIAAWGMYASPPGLFSMVVNVLILFTGGITLAKSITGFIRTAKHLE